MYFKGTKGLLAIVGCLAASHLSARDLSASSAAAGFRKPVCFVENKGQVRDAGLHTRKDIQYKLSTPGMSMYLGSGQLVYQFRKNETDGTRGIGLSGYLMDVVLVGANPHAVAESAEPQSFYENYYFAGKEGFTAHAFNKVTYKDVYPNIDWVVYIRDEKVEYDFVVRLGGNPSDIQLRYDGAKTLAITANGGVEAVTPMGTVQEMKPYAFVKETGLPVASQFILNGNTLTFNTGSYEGTLTIDPYLSWSTYYGGAGDDIATSITSYGGTGLIYVGGYTSSTAGIASGVGLPFNTFGGGTYDAFIAAYSSAGVMSWATYFGGAGDDRGTGITVGSTGNIYLSGYTNSTGLGTAGVFQNTYTAGYDGFLVSFASNGVRQWSTYYGGTSDDYANAVTTDAGGAIYIGGQTASTGMATAGAYQFALSGPTDGFFAKFTTTGTITFASYYGGSAQDDVISIKCDAALNLNITGQTNSSAAIATLGAYQSTLSGTSDAFVAQFSSLGAINWGTYFGGPGVEQGTAITVDGSDNIGVVGNTTSTLGVATANAYKTTFGGVQDAYIAKFTNAGVIQWATYFGGDQSDYGTGIAVDNMNNFAVSGYTLSTTGIVTGTALQAANAGSFDGMLGKFDPLGRNYWSSYFGGTFNDYAYGLTIDANNLLTFAGSTNSSGGLSTAGGVSSSATVQQPAFGGGASDAFITQFTADSLVMITQPFTDTLVCAGGTLNVSYTANTITATTLKVQISDNTGTFPALTTSGIIGTWLSSTLSGTIACTIPAGLSGTGYRIRIISSAPTVISPDDYYDIHIVPSLAAPTTKATSPICLGQTENLSVTASYTIATYGWTGPNGFTSAIYNPSVVAITMADSGMYHVTLTHNGCPNVVDSELVTVDSVVPPTPTVSLGTTACLNYPVSLYGNPGSGYSPLSYQWAGPGGFTSTLQNPVRQDTAGTAIGVYTFTDTYAGCPSASVTFNVALANDVPVTFSITATPGDTVCRGTNISFSTYAVNGGISPTYQWFTGTPDTPIVGATASFYSSSYLYTGETIYCVIGTDQACAFPLHDTSNRLALHIIDSTPVAYITALPDSIVTPGASVSFMAYAVYPGSISVYQWYVDDTLVPGANSYLFTIPSVTTPVRVKVQVFTPAWCAFPNNPFSNTINVRFVSAVAQVASQFHDVDLFPNPNTGTFTLSGSFDAVGATSISYELLNMVGQSLTSGNLPLHGSNLSANFNFGELAEGIYVMHLSGEGQNAYVRFTVRK